MSDLSKTTPDSAASDELSRTIFFLVGVGAIAFFAAAFIFVVLQ